MLIHLSIKNYTIVEALEIEIPAGFTVITGETGAGKSIVVDALMLALGARADTQAIRQGADRCFISAQFDVSKQPEALAWLKTQECDEGTACLITRSVNREGQSRSTINGQACAQNLVRELAELLISIHGQHEHQKLLKPERQRQYLDQFAEHETLMETVHTHYVEWQKLNILIEEKKSQNQNKSDQLALLKFQLDELEQIKLQKNEWETLHQENKKLQHGKQLGEQLDLILKSFQNDARLDRACRSLENLLQYDETLKNATELFVTARIHLEEAIRELENYQSGFNFNPEHIREVEERLNTLHELARKHRVNPPELVDIIHRLREQIVSLQNVEAALNRLIEAQEKMLVQYQQAAEKLTTQRKKFAATLGKKMTEQMQVLGMEGGKFSVVLENNEAHTPQAWGNENIIFQVSTNAGQPFQPLNKVVSGGELSRLGLALQVFVASKAEIPTLIFDEVDTGISGKTASLVGEQLRALGKHAQLLCITHLPQVAALGEHHFKIEKITEGKTTHSKMTLLSKAKRIDEIARMVGGNEITQKTRAHAEELLAL